MKNVTKFAIQRIESICMGKGISLHSFMKSNGLSVASIYEWKKDENIVLQLRSIIEICEVLKIDISQFFKGYDAELTAEQTFFLKEWNSLGDDEQNVLFKVIQVFKDVRKKRKNN